MFVKFLKGGMVAIPNHPDQPQFYTVVGDIKEVSDEHAKILVDVERAEIVDAPEGSEVEEAAHVEDAKSEGDEPDNKPGIIERMRAKKNGE